MDLALQAIVIGIVQGLTEFLPISSSGHLIVLPYMFGWYDPFLESLPFSVMLHVGTLGALLVYFWRDWLRLVPAFFATIRDRSFRDDQDRRLAWLIAAATVPAAIVGFLLNDIIEREIRQVAVVALALVVGAGILWIADRWGAKTKGLDGLGFPGAVGIGVAQAIALVPGVSRSGISISAGLFLGLTRESAARFSFLMSAPIIAGTAVFEARKLLAGEAGVAMPAVPLALGTLAAFLTGLAAIAFLLGYLRDHPLTIFVAYRLVLAAIIVVALLAR
ncbi:MAG: undecaprenyl-diphosphatase UppP [Chloroflexota bacterium]